MFHIVSETFSSPTPYSTCVLLRCHCVQHERGFKRCLAQVFFGSQLLHLCGHDRTWIGSRWPLLILLLTLTFSQSPVQSLPPTLNISTVSEQSCIVAWSMLFACSPGRAVYHESGKVHQTLTFSRYCSSPRLIPFSLTATIRYVLNTDRRFPFSQRPERLFFPLKSIEQVSRRCIDSNQDQYTQAVIGIQSHNPDSIRKG